ncbi:GTP diphosphokinase [Cocleimonas flava]|jgi:GTP pyrophosphokinase|uniref:GTP pyrophosphokinase n=1 Tax=Cocleimonas flava TaxID=634765 RepID=A0A4R1EZ23_9GAMM|nr:MULTISPECIES: bifunctional (p)ppGpp synthetase/guanosine-3',5'-bis(diphosphate) 3'-pyrophosphohydrolase [Cocleimonas]MEB8432875.1 bifunctional (p)ppGpp synthetase/guanosine-3',5'-bis(diphosphate) 3'-pyrophosphohydrolase [Cocleimonas sp. KMM 6892]MEC4715734.1 bifunctional (p)ppGpp synthetase/guanosine-3',5'-bis(diphosphate) 3'-pyrophosphohydrolase [Cocleimonas sp. KMM 6895]MEC4744648.1 bifunctional (p)ppGpp synthetase/guanosine-3',5'-bis(diphosphate) 3'-pyrophosphohydrolase [Cocleimonas sp. KM
MQHSQLRDTSSRTREEWIHRLSINESEEDQQLLIDAIDLMLTVAEFDEDSQVPLSLDVADILRNLQVDQVTLIAAVLSDVRLCDTYSIEEIAEKFSSTIALLVKNMRWLHNFKPQNENEAVIPEQAERLRRMLLAMVDDVRAVLIYLGWRLQYLRLLADAELYDKRAVAQETMDIYAPLANRLGVSQLKWEMEDLAFRYLDPMGYKKIAKSLDAKRLEREAYVEAFIFNLRQFLSDMDIEAEVYGRPKHIYSIWKKMQRKELSIDQLYDLRAVRVIVSDVKACYTALGVVHEKWKHVPAELDDYIANKKPNGYQSLHTVVIGPQGRYVEIQIRTQDMHVFAELGVAAHWRYKEGGAQDAAMERVVSSLRRLLDSDDTDDELLEDFRAEIFPDRVFVLTPQGDIVELSKGSTPLDFAYAIHTSVGHRCNGAKVNGVIVSLDHKLNNGDQVEIITKKEEQPSRKWLNPTLGYVGSASSRSKIRHWFRQQDHGKNLQDGKDVIEQEKHRLNLKKIDLEPLIQRFRFQSKKEFLIALGRGDISVAQLIDSLEVPKKEEVKFRKVNVKNEHNDRGIQIQGVSNLLVEIANCCKPVPGDNIIGYITVGRGITIHREDCPNIDEDNLGPDKSLRLAEASWGTETTAYTVDIQVTGFNKPGLISDVAQVLAKEQINVVSMTTKRGNTELISLLSISIQIENTGQLFDVLEKIGQLRNVMDAKRQK